MDKHITQNSQRDPQTGRYLKRPDIERFWEKVDVRGPDDCWEWQAGLGRGGYGMFWLSGRTMCASRAIWIMLFGDIPSDVFVCHSCDNPPCVNPAHLWIGTHQQNNDDKMQKGRANTVLPPRFSGDQHPNSKLTDAQVKEIQELYRPNAKGLIKQIAKQFNVRTATVWAIGTGKSRRNST